ncbi:serine/threonine-protein kinase LMTK3-like [Eulemur rufifrons]|uniref:serine/threonine-protein kinase LMTK3-like n=1 Tax=Eulemur rufifrons TaxID=859984 RepID=UPI003744AC0C
MELDMWIDGKNTAPAPKDLTQKPEASRAGQTTSLRACAPDPRHENFGPADLKAPAEPPPRATGHPPLPAPLPAPGAGLFAHGPRESGCPATPSPSRRALRPHTAHLPGLTPERLLQVTPECPGHPHLLPLSRERATFSRLLGEFWTKATQSLSHPFRS